jgi:hypothetical protein
MFMPGSLGNVQYTEFKYMGHFRALARYPVHFHVMGDTSRGMVVRGNSVWYSGNRAYVAHESSGILFEDNVSFDTVSSPYFVELTLTTATNRNDCSPLVQQVPQDNAFIHNIGVESAPVDEWNNLNGAPADAFIFWFDQQLYQTVLGNVAVGADVTSGTKTARTAGFQLDEVCSRQVAGKPDYLVFRKNEGHSNRESGLLFWCGLCKPRDYVEFNLWRNGIRGFWWASYVNPARLFNSRFGENGKEGVLLWTIRAHLQDSELIAGSKPSWVNQQTGLNIVAYVASPTPDWPGQVIRTLFQNNSVDVTQAHQTCSSPANENEPMPFRDCTQTTLNLPIILG